MADQELTDLTVLTTLASGDLFFVRDVSAGIDKQVAVSALSSFLPPKFLDDLGDADTTTTPPSTGDFLQFDGANWVPAVIALGDLPAIGLDDLSDVDVTTTPPVLGDCLKFTGSIWEPSATAGPFDLDGNPLTVDVDGDTTIVSPSDDVIRMSFPGFKLDFSANSLKPANSVSTQALTISTGAAITGGFQNSGALFLTSANVVGANGSSGNINIKTGIPKGSGSAGDIIFQTGGTGGDIIFNDSTGALVMRITATGTFQAAGEFDHVGSNIVNVGDLELDSLTKDGAGAILVNSDLDLDGSQIINTILPTRRETSGPYNVLADDSIIEADDTSGSFSVILPATVVAGKEYIVIKVNSGANTVTLDGNGNNITGAATQTLVSQFASISVVGASDAAEWFIKYRNLT